MGFWNFTIFICVGILAAGTNYGRVLIWKYRELRKHDVEGPERWEFLTASGLAGPLIQIKVCDISLSLSFSDVISMHVPTHAVGLSAISPGCQQWWNSTNPS